MFRSARPTRAALDVNSASSPVLERRVERRKIIAHPGGLVVGMAAAKTVLARLPISPISDMPRTPNPIARPGKA